MSSVELSQVVVELGRHTATAVLSDDAMGLQRAISKLGLASKVDRTYIFEFDYIHGSMSNTYEWCADGIHPEIDFLQNLPLNTFPWSRQFLESGEYVAVSDIAELPPEAKAEREILSAQGIKSLILVPIVSIHGTVGFIGFDSVRSHRHWTDSDARMLELAAGFVSVALSRQSKALDVADITDPTCGIQTITFRIIRFASLMDDTVILHDEVGKVLMINEAGQRRLGIGEDQISGYSVFQIQQGVAKEQLELSWEKMRPGDVFRKDGRHVTAFGASFPTNSVVSCFSGAGQKLFLAITRDISNETEARQELLQGYQRLRDLTIHSQQIEYDTRSAIAQRLHDGIGHDLARTKMMLQSIQNARSTDQVHQIVASCIPALDSAILSTRDVMNRVMPPALVDRGLIAAINIMINDKFGFTNTPIQVKAEGDPLVIDHELSLFLYDATSELLQNAITHAAPSLIQLEIKIGIENTEIHVEHGGLKAEPVNEKKNGLGTIAIREKAKMYGGNATWTIDDKRTRILSSLVIPHTKKCSRRGSN